MKRIIEAVLLTSWLLTGNVYALDVVLEARMVHAQGLLIKARTNLPESTKVTVAVTGESTGYEMAIDTTVKNGVIEVGPFADAGNPLKPGLYVSEIFTEAAQFQPESVQSVIGNRGEFLQGVLIRRGMLSNRLYFRADFTLL